MERISPAAGQALARQPAAKALKLIASGMPWAIIAALLWAGLFIKPQPVGGTVQPPVMERRDHFFGAAPAPGGGIWVAGSDGKIVRIGENGGVERLATPTARTLQDIRVWDAHNAVAVGNEGLVLVTRDGGSHWQEVEGVPRSNIANKLTRVRVAPDGRALATGEMGAILLSTDHGASWSRLRDEEDVAWNDAALLADGRIVVVGEFGRLLLSTDGGATWQAPVSPVESSLMSVAFRDQDFGVAVGLEGVVLVTRDAGLSWERAEAGARDHLFDIVWDGENRRWLGAGAMGAWVGAGPDGTDWRAGRVDERDLAWHTRVLPAGGAAWFVGANIGRWDGQRWTTLGH